MRSDDITGHTLTEHVLKQLGQELRRKMGVPIDDEPAKGIEERLNEVARTSIKASSGHTRSSSEGSAYWQTHHSVLRPKP